MKLDIDSLNHPTDEPVQKMSTHLSVQLLSKLTQLQTVIVQTKSMVYFVIKKTAGNST